ncbi:GGDEF domain-containing protein [Sneathiella marina]|uniref:diguanylate cyclase n=1 Tax=Sneathiella marina TaxID=2950108 RepID=A0ABY4W2A3_9PROT|nr:GGDEF domain-containing protein [Sneathiella marina]USG60989.1 GGDEF domain-containing protein [Sneathiella marina]
MFRFVKSIISDNSGTSSPTSELDRLVYGTSHSPLLKRRRARVIVSRIRLLSLLCFVAFPFGFTLDLLAFSGDTLLILGLSRALIALLFLALFFGIGNGETLRDAYRAVGIFFAILLTFQAMYQPLLDLQDISAIAGVPSAGYVLFPFLIVVCIGIFPFTVKEAFLTLVMFYIVEMLILIILPEQSDPHQRLGILLSLVAAGVLCGFSAISQLLYMASLVDQASIDTLTQCYSRNSGEEIIDVQYRIAQREKAFLSVVFVDLDNFKAINDRYGHESGDRVLRSAAEHIAKNGRGSDVLIRWGGEEFVILLPNTNAAGALKTVRRLRNIGLGERPDGSFLTASYGIAEMQSSKANDWQALVEYADDQMYHVKSNGGNDIAMIDSPALAETSYSQPEGSITE